MNTNPVLNEKLTARTQPYTSSPWEALCPYDMGTAWQITEVPEMHVSC